jgi:hypothetical protein
MALLTKHNKKWIHMVDGETKVTKHIVSGI